MRIGILSVQGDFEAHARVLERLNAPYLLVRTPKEAARADAMILPGGESTTMLMFLKEEGLEEPCESIVPRAAEHFWALAPGPFCWLGEVRAPAQPSLGLADLVLTRNAHGPASSERGAPHGVKAQARADGNGLHPCAHYRRGRSRRRKSSPATAAVRSWCGRTIC